MPYSLVEILWPLPHSSQTLIKFTYYFSALSLSLWRALVIFCFLNPHSQFVIYLVIAFVGLDGAESESERVIEPLENAKYIGKNWKNA